MILSILERYVSLSISKIKLERLLDSAVGNEEVENIEKDLRIVKASIDYMHEKIINKISFLTMEELNDLSKCLEFKTKTIKSEMNETVTLLKMSTTNKEVALKNKDAVAVKTYNGIIDDAVHKREEQQEELSCYNNTLTLCLKIRNARDLTKF